MGYIFGWTLKIQGLPQLLCRPCEKSRKDEINSKPKYRRPKNRFKEERGATKFGHLSSHKLQGCFGKKGLWKSALCTLILKKKKGYNSIAVRIFVIYFFTDIWLQNDYLVEKYAEKLWFPNSRETRGSGFNWWERVVSFSGGLNTLVSSKVSLPWKLAECPYLRVMVTV